MKVGGGHGRWLPAGLLGALLACVPAAGGSARELVREDFERGGIAVSAGAPGRTGAGLTYAEKAAQTQEKGAVLRVQPSASRRGTISFDLQRKTGEDASDTRTVAAMQDSLGEDLFVLQVRWSSPGGGGFPEIWLRGSHFYARGLGLWATEIVLDRSVAPGEWIHLDLSWDDDEKAYRLFVDGREVDASPPGDDIRLTVNQANALHAEPPVYSAHPFSELLRRVATVTLGVRPSPEGGGTTPLSNAVLDNFVIHVDEIPPPGYSPPSVETLAIASLSHDAFRAAGFSGKLVAGNALTVTLTGAPGATGMFDVAHYPDLNRKIALDWRGWGVHLEEKTFHEEGEVNLRDVEAYRVYAGKEPLDTAALTLKQVEGGPLPLEPVARMDVKEQAYTLEFLDIDTPYYVAVLAEMRNGTLRPVISPIANRPLAEGPPGVYTGGYQVGYQDRYPRAVLVGRLIKGEAVARAAGDAASAFAIDPRLTIAVETDPKELKADEKSASKVTVTVTDANGNAVSGHKVKFLLATTSQYTGVVGGGAFADQVGGTMKGSAFGETDLFGRLTATYVAGFAAKTAVIVARDMASNDTGAGYVKTYIQAAAELELEPVVRASAMMAEGYEITVTSSDAWLTADGKSQARITAGVTLGGRPVEGHQVDFDVSPGAGSIRTVLGTTDKDGAARAVFTAGKKIGIALITATDRTAGISGSVRIELRSDAPAKLGIQLKPEKLPADGRSRADLRVLVTDINDNPSDNVEVEYRIAQGGGRVRDEKGMTDRRGESATEYVAGRNPGRVSIEITVRSTVPTEEEILKARGLAVAVTDDKFF